MQVSWSCIQITFEEEFILCNIRALRFRLAGFTPLRTRLHPVICNYVRYIGGNWKANTRCDPSDSQ